MTVRKAIIIAVSLLTAVSAAGTGGAFAKELNQRQHLDPRFNLKIQKQIARGWRLQGELGSMDPTSDRLGARHECGSQAVGNVYVPPGARAPREVVTVITGDVINNVGRAGC